MLVPDVNVLVHAHRPDLPGHEVARDWLGSRLAAGDQVGVSELVLSGFLRVVTHRRVFVDPSPWESAHAFCSALLAAPTALALRPGERHWQLFAGLCATIRARGNDIPDAYHAALAVENSATLVSADRGFARFPGLRWEHLPLG